MALALPELLTKIFDFLAEDKALYPALFVSRLWSMCSGPILWRRIELIGNGGAFGEKYEIQLKKFMGLSCYSLRHLGIGGGKSCITDKSICEIPQFNPNIQSLNFNNCEKLTDATIYTLVGSYPDLRELDLSNCEQITDIGIRKIAQCLNLEHLVLNSLGFINDKTICIIVQSCPNIRYLNLEFCYVTDTVVEAIAQSCRNMEYLNIYGSESITDSSISKIAKKCSYIQELELGYCGLITDIVIKDIAHNLSDLKYLGLKYCVNISKEALDTLNPDLDIGGHYTIPSAL
ncbi:1133_t:CDS:2 [Diversispora eburnea]|uniref:1133_t:CDS:1 n=1 Tax=Diversispora eburnea TaxID=1213867 RepID=A0A9N9BZI0_9GLOM|nr:1133_t:CDS:2 [Diversispora eburnea]